MLDQGSNPGGATLSQQTWPPHRPIAISTPPSARVETMDCSKQQDPTVQLPPRQETMDVHSEGLGKSVVHHVTPDDMAMDTEIT